LAQNKVSRQGPDQVFRRSIMNKFVTIVRTSLFVAAVAASAPAFADTLDSTPSVKVGYSDLDLSTASGQHRLHNRLAGAAREVCEGNAMSGSMGQPAVHSCMQLAMTRADTQFAALVSSSQPQVAVADPSKTGPAR
jgi:UrcA family protein